MLSTFHLLTGGAIGTYRFSWPNAIALAFVSHFMLDRFPHWDLIMPPYYPTYTWAWVDMIFGWSLIFFFLYLRRFNSWFLVLSACVFAILPDVIQFAWSHYLPSYLYLDAATRFHIAIQWTVSPWLGIPVQIIWAVCMILCFFRKDFFCSGAKSEPFDSLNPSAPHQS